MFVVVGADEKVYRVYTTIGQCWKCDLILPRRGGWTYREFFRAVQRGETVACHSFFVRKCNGAADIGNFERTKAEWDAAKEAARSTE